MAISAWGPRSAFGIGIAAATFVLDQASKWYVLRVLDLDNQPPMTLAPFLDLLMAWNKGVSYSLFTTDAQLLLVGLSLAISVLLVAWLAKAHGRLQAFGFGLLLGGALGNALDRLLHGAVADFVHLHWGTFSWYVFNVADIAIVAGVVLLIYDGLFGKTAQA